MSFEIGLVLLMPVIFRVSRRSGLSLMKIGIPALAGLSAMHGLVPPHPGLLGWLVAVLIRLATSSATVATVTAAGILAPLVATLDPGTTSLLVLAIGSGSLFLSHVNDAGFWLVKEHFGISVGQTLRTWSVMETLISVVGLVFVLLLGLVI
jgi:H+/gluconate symporter-like permease